MRLKTKASMAFKNGARGHAIYDRPTGPVYPKDILKAKREKNMRGREERGDPKCQFCGYVGQMALKSHYADAKNKIHCLKGEKI